MNNYTTSKSHYIAVWFLLMVLLFLTWGVAEFNLGILNTIAAIAIALAKMLLIILFFMHVRFNSRLTWLFAAAGFVWFLIMIGLTMTDYLSRDVVVPYSKGVQSQQEKSEWSANSNENQRYERPGLESGRNGTSSK